MCTVSSSFFFLNDPATTEIYTLPLHDSLPILVRAIGARSRLHLPALRAREAHDRILERRGIEGVHEPEAPVRSEEHTSELQSRQYLVCRLLLEKKKNKITLSTITKSTLSRLRR